MKLIVHYYKNFFSIIIKKFNIIKNLKFFTIAIIFIYYKFFFNLFQKLIFLLKKNFITLGYLLFLLKVNFYKKKKFKKL